MEHKFANVVKEFVSSVSVFLFCLHGKLAIINYLRVSDYMKKVK